MRLRTLIHLGLAALAFGGERAMAQQRSDAQGKDRTVAVGKIDHYVSQPSLVSNPKVARDVATPMKTVLADAPRVLTKLYDFSLSDDRKELTVDPPRPLVSSRSVTAKTS